MKNNIIIIFCLLACVVNVQWDYPVRYGAEEWKTLKTVEE